MDKIYLISGLGADYRLFKYIEMPGYEVVYIHWIEPDNNDTLATYAAKLIDNTTYKQTLLYLAFR